MVVILVGVMVPMMVVGIRSAIMVRMRLAGMVQGMLVIEIMIVKALLLTLMPLITKMTQKWKYLGAADQGRNHTRMGLSPLRVMRVLKIVM